MSKKETKRQIKDLDEALSALKNNASKVLTEKQIDEILGLDTKRELVKFEKDLNESKRKRKEISKVRNLKIAKSIGSFLLPFVVCTSISFSGTAIWLSNAKDYDYDLNIITASDSYTVESNENAPNYSITVLEKEDDITKVTRFKPKKVKEEDIDNIVNVSSIDELYEKEYISESTSKETFYINDSLDEDIKVSYSENIKNKNSYRKAYENREEYIGAVLGCGTLISMLGNIMTSIVLSMMDSLNKGGFSMAKNLKEQARKEKPSLKEATKDYKQKKKEYKEIKKMGRR